MRGAPARAIQELAGHMDLTTTPRYTHLSPGRDRRRDRLLDQGPAEAGHYVHSGPVHGFGDILETGDREISKSLAVEHDKWWRRRESNYANPLSINNLAEKQSVKTARIAQNRGSRYITGTQKRGPCASAFHPLSQRQPRSVHIQEKRAALTRLHVPDGLYACGVRTVHPASAFRSLRHSLTWHIPCLGDCGVLSAVLRGGL